MILTIYDEDRILRGLQRQIIVPMIKQDFERPGIVYYGKLLMCVDSANNRVAVTRLQPGVVVPLKYLDGEFVVERVEVLPLHEAAKYPISVGAYGYTFPAASRIKWDSYYGPGVRKVLKYGTVQMHAKWHPKNTDIYSWDKNPWCWVYHVIAYKKDRQVHRVQG